MLCASLVFASGATAGFYPEAGKTLYSDSGTTVDATNKNKGYFRAKQKTISKKVKLRVKLGSTQLDYDLAANDEYQVFPFQLGDGTYSVLTYKQVSGNRYTAAFSKKIKVKLEDEFLPFLCPNQYVWYGADSKVVKKAEELCAGLTDDREKFNAVGLFLKNNIMYDFFTAMQITSGAITVYLPDLDNALATKKGICFDYAALFSAMMRSQGIPCKLIIGHADKTFHAWVSAYINGTWLNFDPTFASTGGRASTYTAERWY